MLTSHDLAYAHTHAHAHTHTHTPYPYLGWCQDISTFFWLLLLLRNNLHTAESIDFQCIIGSILTDIYLQVVIIQIKIQSISSTGLVHLFCQPYLPPRKLLCQFVSQQIHHACSWTLHEWKHMLVLICVTWCIPQDLFYSSLMGYNIQLAKKCYNACHNLVCIHLTEGVCKFSDLSHRDSDYHVDYWALPQTN